MSLQHEVNICRVEQPYVHRPVNQLSDSILEMNPDSPQLVMHMDETDTTQVLFLLQTPITKTSVACTINFIFEVLTRINDTFSLHAAGNITPIDKGVLWKYSKTSH